MRQGALPTARVLKSLWVVVVPWALFSRNARADSVAASCGSKDVQAAIDTAKEGETVDVPACPSGVSWTGGVKIAGKGVTLRGAGAGRVVGVSVTPAPVAIGTGTKKLSGVIAATVKGALSSAPPPLTAGETLRVYENGFVGNFMVGTVTSLLGGVLTLNVTSSGGSCGAPAPANTMQSNCKRWLISTPAETVVKNDLGSGAMIDITEDGSYHTTITGIRFAQGSGGGGTASAIYIGRKNPDGVAVRVHDDFFESNQADIIDGDSNRGVIYDNSFMFSPFSQGQFAAIRIKDASNGSMSYSWSTPSTMGTDDKTGESNLYFETNDVHADGVMTDFDDNSRAVVRYNFLNNAGGGTHGADTSFIGVRHFEFYDNVGRFDAYTDGTTANMNWWMFVRGGTFVWHDNTLPAIGSQDWGDKSDINVTVMTLERQDNYPCWGAGFSTAGEYYPAPRQVGFGHVTGGGTVTYAPLGFTGASTTSNAMDYSGSVYVGDSEPAYIWNNNRMMRIGFDDYGTGASDSCPASPTPDTTASYFASGRDYFNGTPKPGYTPYTYPHPLTVGAHGPSPPDAGSGEGGSPVDAGSPPMKDAGAPGADGSATGGGKPGSGGGCGCRAAGGASGTAAGDAALALALLGIIRLAARSSPVRMRGASGSATPLDNLPTQESWAAAASASTLSGSGLSPRAPDSRQGQKASLPLASSPVIRGAIPSA